jgi:hypothetical protein
MRRRKVTNFATSLGMGQDTGPRILPEIFGRLLAVETREVIAEYLSRFPIRLGLHQARGYRGPEEV